MNHRPELLQQLLDSITYSMKEYTSKVEDDKNISYSIDREFAEIYIKETSNINLAYSLYQLAVERINVIQSLHDLWEIQKEVVKGKTPQVVVIKRTQEMVEEYMSAYKMLTNAISYGPLYISSMFVHYATESNAAEITADVSVYLRNQLEEFLENNQNTWYKISFKK